MTELTDFFAQILHTERSLSSRNVKLRKLQEEIQSCVKALQQVCQEVETRRGELAVRNVKMVDHEVEAKLLDMRQSILEEQKNKLTRENQIMFSELEALKLQKTSDSEGFLDELKEFGKSYDLIGTGYKHREQLTQKRISTLQDELLLLEAELTEFESEKEEVRKLEKMLMEVEETLAKKQELKKSNESQLLEDEREIEQLKAECAASNSKNSDDPEILKLQHELEECKDCPEERMYHSLQKELEELQRLCYHRQMREHMSRRKNRETDHYKPYTKWYGGSSRVEHDKKSGRDSIERDVEVSGSLGGMEEAGDVEDTEEGWDDELEAAELALFQESLSVSDMEWVEDEETEHSRLSVGSKAIERERESNFEHGEKLRKKLKERQEHSLSKTPCSDATVSHNQHKYSFIKPRYPSGQSTSKAVRSVVKKGGDLAQLTSVTDSPLPGTIPPKKSSGQSIYKAPGHREPLQTGFSKTAKKVRFRY